MKSSNMNELKGMISVSQHGSESRDSPNCIGVFKIIKWYHSDNVLENEVYSIPEIDLSPSSFFHTNAVRNIGLNQKVTSLKILKKPRNNSILRLFPNLTVERSCDCNEHYVLFLETNTKKFFLDFKFHPSNKKTNVTVHYSRRDCNTIAREYSRYVDGNTKVRTLKNTLSVREILRFMLKVFRVLSVYRFINPRKKTWGKFNCRSFVNYISYCSYGDKIACQSVITAFLNDIVVDLTKMDFNFSDLVGYGTFSQIFRKKINQEICCIKVFRDQNIPVDEIKKEVSFLFSLSHPNIIECLGWSKSGTKSIITQSCSNDVLRFFNSRKFFDKKEKFLSKIEVLYQTACGICYLHSNKVIHRDLKWQNVLIRKNPGENESWKDIVKIIDFGISARKNDEDRTTFCGSKFFCSPQIVSREGYDEKADVFSYGIMIFQLIFDLDTRGMEKWFYKNIGVFAANPQILPRYPRKAKEYELDVLELMKKCYDFDPEKRPSFNEICESFPTVKKRILLNDSENEEFLK